MNKGTKLFAGFLGKIGGAFQDALSDGVITVREDAIKFFGVLTSLNDAGGAKELRKEALMDEESRDEVFQEFRSNLQGKDERLDRNLTDIVGGIYATYNVGLRQGLEEGVEQGRAEILEELKNNTLQMDGYSISCEEIKS